MTEEFIEELTKDLYENLAWTGLDYDSRKMCAEDLYEKISKKLIAEFQKDIKKLFAKGNYERAYEQLKQLNPNSPIIQTVEKWEERKKQ